MNVYKVIFNGTKAIAAIPQIGLQHGDIGLTENMKTVEWYAVECEDDETAIKTAGDVIRALWTDL